MAILTALKEAEYERPCDHCNGDGFEPPPDRGGAYFCAKCYGASWIPTEAGELVLAIREKIESMDHSRELTLSRSYREPI